MEQGFFVASCHRKKSRKPTLTSLLNEEENRIKPHHNLNEEPPPTTSGDGSEVKAKEWLSFILKYMSK